MNDKKWNINLKTINRNKIKLISLKIKLLKIKNKFLIYLISWLVLGIIIFFLLSISFNQLRINFFNNLGILVFFSFWIITLTFLFLIFIYFLLITKKIVKWQENINQSLEKSIGFVNFLENCLISENISQIKEIPNSNDSLFLEKLKNESIKQLKIENNGIQFYLDKMSFSFKINNLETTLYRLRTTIPLIDFFYDDFFYGTKKTIFNKKPKYLVKPCLVLKICDINEEHYLKIQKNSHFFNDNIIFEKINSSFFKNDLEIITNLKPFIFFYREENDFFICLIDFSNKLGYFDFIDIVNTTNTYNKKLSKEEIVIKSLNEYSNTLKYFILFLFNILK